LTEKEQHMKKIRRFTVLQMVFHADEKPTIPLIYSGLKDAGVAVSKIQWKGENRLKIRIWLDTPEKTRQDRQASRHEAVSAIINKVQGCFKGAAVAGADLIGLPWRIVVSEKSLKGGGSGS